MREVFVYQFTNDANFMVADNNIDKSEYVMASSIT